MVPWTVFWERNYFLEATWLGRALTSHPARGAISGLGVVCLVAALAELRALWPRRRIGTGAPADGGQASPS